MYLSEKCPIGVNALITSECPVAGYMSKIGSDGEKSCDACIDGSTWPAVVFCCTCHELLCSYCHEDHKYIQKLSNHPTVEFGEESLKLPSTK